METKFNEKGGAAPPNADGPFGIRAVQLDLARQMETPEFIGKYLAFAADSGYNTVQLYLEGRVRTKSFPFRPEGETYSPERMRGIADEARRLGLDLVPVVNILGHAEQFVNCPELDDICEESRAGGKCRFEGNGLKRTFCFSAPRTREFLGAYLDELMEIFPSGNFHVGLDESFNTGFCPECAAKMRTVGLGGLYREAILWAHGHLARKGRRMWMWDDFFEFFPQLVEDLPDDIVMCDWEYSTDISRNRGHYGCFGDRFRKDWMRYFHKRGMTAIACPAQGRRPMTRYCDWAESCGEPNGMFVLWEMSDCFHARSMVLARATGLRWSGGLASMTYDESVAAAVRSLFPDLKPAERAAVATLATDGPGGAAGELALATLAALVPEPVVGDPFAPLAMLDDLVTAARQSRLAAELVQAEYEMTGIYRTPARIASAKRRLSPLRAQIGEIAARRARQESAWRPGCRPNEMTRPSRGLSEKLDRLLAVPETAADDGEWQLELSLFLPDFHGIPNWTVEGRFDGEWKMLAKGGWKPNGASADGAEWCYFERVFPFRAEKAPAALRISYKGYNDAGLAYAAVAGKAGRLVPAKVVRAAGRVENAGNILEDTVEPVMFGNPNCRAAMLSPSLADELSVLEVELGPEF